MGRFHVTHLWHKNLYGRHVDEHSSYDFLRSNKSDRQRKRFRVVIVMSSRRPRKRAQLRPPGKLRKENIEVSIGFSGPECVPGRTS